SDPVVNRPSPQRCVMRSRRSPRFAWPSLAALAVLLPLGPAALPRPADGPGAALPRPPAEFECRWADTPITLDGNADEAAWKHAQVIVSFSLPWLGKDARPARTATKARLLWDREYLYFFADMEDSDLYAEFKGHDGPASEGDCFGLYFKPADDKPG